METKTFYNYIVFENGDIYFIELSTQSELWKCFPIIGDSSIEMYVLAHAFKHSPVKKDSDNCYCEYDFQSEYSKNGNTLYSTQISRFEVDWSAWQNGGFGEYPVGFTHTNILFQAINNKE